MGRLIPAGTGAVMNRFRALAAERDKTVQIEAEEEIGDNFGPQADADTTSLPAGE